MKLGMAVGAIQRRTSITRSPSHPHGGVSLQSPRSWWCRVVPRWSPTTSRRSSTQHYLLHVPRDRRGPWRCALGTHRRGVQLTLSYQRRCATGVRRLRSSAATWRPRVWEAPAPLTLPWLSRWRLWRRCTTRAVTSCGSRATPSAALAVDSPTRSVASLCGNSGSGRRVLRAAAVWRRGPPTTLHCCTRRRVSVATSVVKATAGA